MFAWYYVLFKRVNRTILPPDFYLRNFSNQTNVKKLLCKRPAATELSMINELALLEKQKIGSWKFRSDALQSFFIICDAF